jgi:hypothetical protein
MMNRPLRNLILIAVVILSGILVTIYSRSRILNTAEIEKNKFICTYSDLAIAKEQFPAGSDSLRLKLTEIYKTYGTDSTWMKGFLQVYSDDIEAKAKLWDKIVERLDSLRLGADKNSN